MSKGLEALKEIKYMLDAPYTSGIIKQGFDIIEKELKALEIIKDKGVSMAILIQSTNVEEYNYCKNLLAFDLTKEEYDLLKEVLL